jgi:hypothetical protein
VHAPWHSTLCLMASDVQCTQLRMPTVIPHASARWCSSECKLIVCSAPDISCTASASLVLVAQLIVDAVTHDGTVLAADRHVQLAVLSLDNA